MSARAAPRTPGGAGALPLFWQLLLLLLSAVLLAQLAGFALLFVNPPPRPPFYRLGELAAVLRGAPILTDDDRSPMLRLRHADAAPSPGGGMIADAGMTAALAKRLGTAESNIRLFYEPERMRETHVRRRRRREPVAIRDGDALFFTPLVAAVRRPGGWRVIETPPRSFIGPWQRNMLLWLVAIALLLVPLAWWFARALTRPIRRFAEAAERLGGDPRAPALVEEGPAELRTAARTLNGMQARIAGYVGERTQMIGAIAHDLRTPLARIAFRIEAAPEPLRDKVLADIEQMRAMLAATIGFVRDTARGGERVAIEVAALLEVLVVRERELGHALTLEPPLPAARVHADPLAFERMLQNLIDNGTVYGGAVALSLEVEGATAVVRVADRGPGLPDAMLLRAFEPFVRGDPSRNRATGGIGLGLAIARAIAEDHGGTIALANRDGGGLSASVTVPLLS